MSKKYKKTLETDIGINAKKNNLKDNVVNFVY